MSDPLVHVLVTDRPLSVDEALEAVAHPGAGGTVVFLGTVRDRSEAGEVTGITYEAWEELATRRLHEIGELGLRGREACRIALLHRHGHLAVGEISVVVAASAPHREEAFAACRGAIELLKRDVPIWKKEALVTGEARWVQGA